MASGEFTRRKENMEAETSAIFGSLKAVEAFIVCYQKIEEKWVLTVNATLFQLICDS